MKPKLAAVGNWAGQVDVMPWQCSTVSATTASFARQRTPNNDGYWPVSRKIFSCTGNALPGVEFRT